MARFALRKKKKIASQLGEGYLKRILDTLKDKFDPNVPSYEEKGHKVIRVGEFEFYIIKKKYDVYQLAFKGKI